MHHGNIIHLKWFYVKTNIIYNNKTLTLQEYNKINKEGLMLTIINSFLRTTPKFISEIFIINNSFTIIINKKEDLLKVHLFKSG